MLPLGLLTATVLQPAKTNHFRYHIRPSPAWTAARANMYPSSRRCWRDPASVPSGRPRRQSRPYGGRCFTRHCPGCRNSSSVTGRFATSTPSRRPDPSAQRFSSTVPNPGFRCTPHPLSEACASTHLYPPPSDPVIGVSPPWLAKPTLRPERSGIFRFSGCRFPRIRAFAFANSGRLLSLYVLNHTFGWAKSFFWRMR